MAEPDPESNIEQWRAEVRAWLASVLPRRADTPEEGGDYSVFQNISEEAERDLLDRVREYRRKRYDAGYGAIALPKELGGAGLSMRYVIAFTDEERAFATPQSTELISVTTGLVGPTIATFGTEEQRAKFATAFLRSDLLCCQLFSEPAAGSDLAAVATSAVRDETGWVLNGQKVWSSGALFADYGLLLARTDPEVPKQAGLTMFLIQMQAPGVEVRPIRQMSGASSFNEVFLSGVHVGDDMRVGAVGDGWKVANATLGFERTASGQATRRKGGSFADLLALARRLGRSADPVVRQQLADVYVRTELRAATTERVARAAAAGAAPGPGASIGKLVASRNLTLIGDVAASLLGARLVADSGEPDAFAWTEHVLGAPGYRLAGGTDEVQRTIIGERVLGLPREPRVDKGVPYAKLPRNA
ncbi:MAG TPA: acyl-CoA dehydrogenase family protein [Kribbellaceae bacterium]|jgi:alkylation response protein AidB-like acyl-CoA dehydrogenase